MKLIDEHYYLLGSRILTHALFWILYYISFSLLWAVDGNYYNSFGLELVLMPLRIMASYVVMYYLIPRYLLDEKEFRFALAYFVVILVAGLGQRVLVYYYYELLIPDTNNYHLFDAGMIIRAMVLVNTTVLLLSAVKIFQHWKIERTQKSRKQDEILEIRAEKRNYRIPQSSIMYVEGMGNYVTFYLENDQKLISYNSMKEVEKKLGIDFLRIHKSFIINKGHIHSYTHENVEIGNRILPIGKSVEIKF